MIDDKIVKRQKTDREVIDIIVSLIGEDNNIAIPNGYPESFVGISPFWNSDSQDWDYRAMYNSDSMVIELMTEDKISEEEAREWLEFNTFYTKPPGSNEVIYLEEEGIDKIIGNFRDHKDNKVIEAISGVEVISIPSPSNEGVPYYVIK